MEDLWYSGLRAVERRAVNREDALVIDDLRRDRLFRLLLALAGAPAVLGLGCIAAILFGTREPIVLAGTAAGFFAVALRPWRTVPAFLRQLTALSSDMESGEVLICRGQGRDLVFALSAEQRLEPAALVKGSREASVEIALLSESGAVVAVNGERVSSWNQTQRGATAAKSEHAQFAAKFVANNPNDEGVGVGDRPLSTEELAELLAHATPLSVIDRALLLALALVAIVSWWHAFALKATTLLLPIISLVAFVWLAVRFLRRWRIHRRFAADLLHARVAIVTFEEGRSVVEFLPFSGFVWSENHVASPWRRLPLRRRTFSRRSRL